MSAFVQWFPMSQQDFIMRVNQAFLSNFGQFQPYAAWWRTKNSQPGLNGLTPAQALAQEHFVDVMNAANAYITNLAQ